MTKPAATTEAPTATAAATTAGPTRMNGADMLCETLLANRVDVCFANPGTSEMHFVAALDRQPRMRCVLGLFEGVVTGAEEHRRGRDGTRRSLWRSPGAGVEILEEVVGEGHG